VILSLVSMLTPTDDEDPLPTCKISQSPHAFMNGRHHDTSKHSTDLTRGSKQSSPLGDLCRLVPCANDVDSTCVCAGFAKSKEKPDDAQLGNCFNGSRDHLRALGFCSYRVDGMNLPSNRPRPQPWWETKCGVRSSG